ncbi:MAG: serine hydrolase [Candidatus Kapabacteria bacterium]|nr:serine hydrolase [Candidatus Kapabacteria bacterium]
MRIILVLFLVVLVSPLTAQNLYFPPITGAEWQRMDPSELNWCADRIDSLVRYTGETHAKALIILKDGKIVLEKYYDTFTQDSVWYWASAGKTVTSVLVGQAQERGLVDITKSSKTYLGAGWSSCTPAQEDAITVRHHLTMTTGLEGRVADDNCKDPSCLTYKAAPGTLWDYYNAGYLLLQDVVAKASGLSYQQYYARNLATRTGMGGLWIDGVLYSKPRAMARFGLLLLAGGVWNGDTILHDQEYLHAMKNTSQDLNKSYGYLFWLNGKGSYMQPGVPFVYNTDLIPAAPDDLYSGLGKNDQKVYVVPSQGLVVVRMGDKAKDAVLAVSGFDNELWQYISALQCSTTAVHEERTENSAPSIWPNPASDVLHHDGEEFVIRSVDGRVVARGFSATIDVNWLASGSYIIESTRGIVTRRSILLKQ